MKAGPGEGEAVRVERRHIYEKVPTVTVLKTYTVGKKKLSRNIGSLLSCS